MSLPDFIWPARILYQEAGGPAIQLPPAIGLPLVLFFILLNGFFVATEFALVSVRRSRIEQLVAEGRGSAVILQNAIEHLDTYIATTQLGITMASLALGWVGEPAVAEVIKPWLVAVLPTDWAAGASEAISVALAFAGITVLSIILGEFAPKGLAIQRSESTALFVALPATIFLRVFRPVIYLINRGGNMVLRMLGLQTGQWEQSVHSVDELRYIVRSSREAGVLETAEADIANRALTLGDLTARSVMVPRTEMVSVPLDITRQELLDLAGEEHHVRFPVYKESPATVAGIIHLTDIFAREKEHPEEPFSVQAVMRPPFFVPESVKGDRLLAQLKTNRTHTAMVVDEFGDVAGMVTLQDLVERIVGQMPEIDEEQHSHIETLPDGSVRVDGLTPLAEVAGRFALKLEESDAETLGGYVLETLGRVPEVGDEMNLQDYTLRVTQMDGPRVAEVLLTKGSRPAQLANAI